MGFRWPWQRRQDVDELGAAREVAERYGGDGTTVPPEHAMRRRLRYSGQVQAVGFRFQAGLLAKDIGVTGWVENLDDGDVLLEVQGSPDQVKNFEQGIDDLSASKNTWIQARLVSSEDLSPVSEKDFRVNY